MGNDRTIQNVQPLAVYAGTVLKHMLRFSRISRILALFGSTALLGCLGPAQQTVKAVQPDQDPTNTPPTYQFNGKVAWDYLVKQVAYGPRVPGTDAQIKCRDYILSELKKSCDDAHVQESNYHWSVNGHDLRIYNVIGTQNWKDAKVRMVLLAHWDSRPWADGPNSPTEDHDKPIPGADDGASGVAVILELAQAIKDKHPGLGILYLLDDGEDLGPDISQMLLGVRYFADNLPTPKPDYGILLDMIGQKNLEVPMEQESYKSAPTLTKAFYLNAMKVGLGKTFPYKIGDDIEDDHLPLIAKGVPTLDLIDFQYPYWHTVEDTPEHCSQQALVDTGDALESFLTRNSPWAPPAG
jgi:glutaminyl-peptide cyclotransferase